MGKGKSLIIHAVVLTDHDLLRIGAIGTADPLESRVPNTVIRK